MSWCGGAARQRVEAVLAKVDAMAEPQLTRCCSSSTVVVVVVVMVIGGETAHWNRDVRGRMDRNTANIPPPDRPNNPPTTHPPPTIRARALAARWTSRASPRSTGSPTAHSATTAAAGATRPSSIGSRTTPGPPPPALHHPRGGERAREGERAGGGGGGGEREIRLPSTVGGQVTRAASGRTAARDPRQ